MNGSNPSSSSAISKIFTDNVTTKVNFTGSDQTYHTLNFTLAEESDILVICSERVWTSNQLSGPIHNPLMKLDGVTVFPQGDTSHSSGYNSMNNAPASTPFYTPISIMFKLSSVAAGAHTLIMECGIANTGSTGSINIGYSVLMVFVLSS